jgi:hypothetical protein
MEEKKYKKIKFMIYPPGELIEEYERLAKENNRSVSGEIVYVLQQNLKRRPAA